jgi:hypothetical protein
MSLWKNRPKCDPTHFFVKANTSFSPKLAPKFVLLLYAVLKKLPQESDHSLGENLPNLVTLIVAISHCFPVFVTISLFTMEPDYKLQLKTF